MEVYTSTKPGSPRRAVAASLVLLFGVMALATTMTWSRSAGSLGPAIVPEGWDLSFRVPRRFRPGPLVSTPLGPAYPFFGQARNGPVATLVVRRMANDAAQTPRELCARVLREHSKHPRTPLEAIRGSGMEVSARNLGRMTGAEIFDPARLTVVRAAVHVSGWGYAVSLGVEGPGIDENMYRLFDSTCASFEDRTPRWTPQR